MKGHLFKGIIFSFFIASFLTFTNQGLAQSNGKISGKVIEANTNAPLIGANVIIQGTSLGAAADLNGNFMIPIVPLGKCTLRISYIGYSPKIMQIDLTKSNPDLHLIIKLEHETIQGKTVTVTAQAEGQNQAINQQLSSNTITNVVSSSRIQQLPDATAAESVGRLPGISIVRSQGEGDQVTVRGMSPQYNSVQLDGVTMSSTSSSNRSVDLSMISPTMLSSIEVTKAPTADMDANSLGGTVDLIVKEAPKGLHYDVLAQGGYNALIKSYNNYKFVAGISNRFFNDKLGVFINGYGEKLNVSTNQLGVTWIYDYSGASPLRYENLNLLSRQEYRKRYGGSIILDYQLPFGKIKWMTFASRMDKDILNQSQSYNGQDGFRVGYNTTEGGLNYTDQLINSMQSEFNLFSGVLNVDLSSSLGQQNQPAANTILGWGTYSLTENKNNLYFLDYLSHLKVNYDQLELGWLTANSYFNLTRNYTGKVDYKLPFKFGEVTSGFLKFGGKYSYSYRNYENDSRTIVISGNTLTNPSKVILANMPQLKDRNKFGEVYVPDLWDNHFDNSTFFNGKYDITPFISFSNFNQIKNIVWNYYKKDNLKYNINPQTYSSAQMGNESLVAGYIMTSLNFLNNKIIFIPGVRFEKMTQEYTGNQFDVPLNTYDWSSNNVTRVTVKASNQYFFPMIHLRVKPTDWCDVRLAYTETASRPNYSELVPYRVMNPNNKTGDPSVGATNSGGNPYLKPQISHNWDLYTSFYTNEIGLFTVGLFYKKIDGLIWQASYYLSDTIATHQFGLPAKYKGYTYTYPENNQYPGYLKGIELDWQTNFWYLPAPFSYLVFNINYTLMNSETKYPSPYITKDNSTFPPKTIRVDTTYSQAFIGQPKNIINIALGVDYKGFSGRISYLYQDGSLSSISPQKVLNSYVNPYSRVDVKVSQKLPVNGLEVFLDFNNITNSADRTYTDTPYYIASQEYYGMSIDGGLRYQF